MPQPTDGIAFGAGVSAIASLAVAASLLAWSATACAQGAAQDYPNRPIRIIVPFTAAGPTDNNARLVGQKLTEAWGQPVVVENRPAAGGVPGTELVAKAAPDGYTLLAANPGPLTIAPSLVPSLPYDTLRDFAPVILVTITSSVVALHPSTPIGSVRELIAYAKAHPGKLNYGSPGIGTVGHLTIELFDSMAGIRMTHVPYKGIAPATTDFLAGRLDVLQLSVPTSLPLLKGGKIKAIGVTGRKRSPLLPDMPTVDEAGLSGFEAFNWNGLFAPAGTPREIVAKLHGEIARRALSAEMREHLIAQGFEIAGYGPDEYTAFIRAEIAKWANVIKTAGVKAE
jgi:tripartite-type tricarboxylate transporter receptor subunit TctC